MDTLKHIAFIIAFAIIGWFVVRTIPDPNVKALEARIKSATEQNQLLHKHNAQLDAANSARQARIDSLAGRNTVLLARSKTYRDSTERLKRLVDATGVPRSPVDPRWMVRSLNQDTIIARQDTTIDELTLVTINDTAQINLFRKMYKSDSSFKDSVLTHADTVLHLAKDAIAVADCKFAHFFHCPSRKEALVGGTILGAAGVVGYDLFIKPRLAHK